MSYNNNIIQTLGVDDESTYGKKLSITVAVDTLGMCTISFGSSYSIRIPEDDVDALRDVLYSASRAQMVHRVNQNGTQNHLEQDYVEAINACRENEEQLRRDEKNGLYPERWDDSN